MNNINCIIVDDNEIDQLFISSFVKQIPEFNICGIYSNATDAFNDISKNKIDILFLDIDLPDFSGIELRKKLQEIPTCVFITSHPEHAVDSFEVDAIDFLVKPIKFDRFNITVNRIIDYLTLKDKANIYEKNLGGDVIFIKQGHKKIKLNLYEIVYLEALKDYTKIATKDNSYCVLETFGNILNDPSFKSFKRVHRSFAVQKNFVQQIQSQKLILINDINIPIGRSFKDNISIED